MVDRRPSISSMISLFIVACYTPHEIAIKPSPLSPNEQKKFGKRRSFYVSAQFKLHCVGSPSKETTINWEIKSVNDTAKKNVAWRPSSTINRQDLFIAAGTLDYGLYEFQFTIGMVDFPRMVTSNSTYIEIIHLNSTANLIKFGTSMITSSHDKVLILDPGKYSFDPDQGELNREV